MKPTLGPQVCMCSPRWTPDRVFGSVVPGTRFLIEWTLESASSEYISIQFSCCLAFYFASDRDYIDRNRSPRDGCSEQVEIVLYRGSYIVAYT